LISIPIRSRHKEGKGPRRQVDAVLNIDALSDEAAKDLREQWDRLAADRNNELVELVESIGLYF